MFMLQYFFVRGFSIFTILLLSRPPMNSVSSQQCRPISTQSITSTDSADSEENYVAMVSLGSREGRDPGGTGCSLITVVA